VNLIQPRRDFFAQASKVGVAGEFNLEPPAFQLHFWNGTGLVTHTAGIGDFAGPCPFRSGGRLIG
jgi:hypothetical protein